MNDAKFFAGAESAFNELIRAQRKEYGTRIEDYEKELYDIQGADGSGAGTRRKTGKQS